MTKFNYLILLSLSSALFILLKSFNSGQILINLGLSNGVFLSLYLSLFYLLTAYYIGLTKITNEMKYIYLIFILTVLTLTLL